MKDSIFSFTLVRVSNPPEWMFCGLSIVQGLALLLFKIKLLVNFLSSMSVVKFWAGREQKSDSYPFL